MNDDNGPDRERADDTMPDPNQGPVEQSHDADADIGAPEAEVYEPSDGRVRIGWKRGLLVVLVVVGVWTVTDYRRRSAYSIDWSGDLSACLEQAKAQNKPVILLVHKKDCELTEIKEAEVFSTYAAYEWSQGGLPCRLIWQEHPDVVAKYKLVESPTLLVLNPEGEQVFRWDGEGITIQIRKRFLKYAVGHEDDATYRRDGDGDASGTPSKSPTRTPR